VNEGQFVMIFITLAIIGAVVAKISDTLLEIRDKMK